MVRVWESIRQYQSPLVSGILAEGGTLDLPNLKVFLAKSFGFCDGVRRAIEIAYATCCMFKGRRIWLIGEIIHNPAVNARLDAMGLRHLPWKGDDEAYSRLTPEDVVIIPAFGLPVSMRRMLEEKGVALVDSTCGNVVKVWQRVRAYAAQGITSVIHGKSRHEETLATASQSLGEGGEGHYIVIAGEREALFLADYLLGKGSREAFFSHFSDSISPGFDPDLHLREIGVANQTTMLKGETARIQELLRAAIRERDGDDARFHAFDTICGATQDRQNALFELLEKPLDAMFIVGGYNSSNTTHLAKIAAARLPVFFVESSDCLSGLDAVRGYDLETRQERTLPLPSQAADLSSVWRVGITAGASCPDNVIEQVIRRLASLRGHELPA